MIVDGRSATRFVEAVFPGLRDDTPLYACPDEAVASVTEVRPGSPPPVFDTFRPLVHPNYPLLAILITEGEGSVESTPLDDQLFAFYSASYGSTADPPERPQRLINGLAFLEPTAVIDTNEVSPGVGLVLPQLADAPPIVYRLNPRFGSNNSYGPHAFIKFLKLVVPRPDPASVAALERLGFSRWTPPADSG